MFKLTEDEINYILEEYCDSPEAIEEIEDKLSKKTIIKSEEDFIELAELVSSRYNSMVEILNVKLANTTLGPTKRDELTKDFLDIDDMIKTELVRKYIDELTNEYSDESLEAAGMHIVSPKI